MDTWLSLVRAASDIATLATAVITIVTTLGNRRRAAKQPPAQHES
ncbi:hypothetical protein ACFC4C_10645 [Streptomyces sp. NPDC056039]